jgi:hypothetical protein
MKFDLNEVLQWTGAFFISAGHVLNAIGSAYHQDIWNQLSFAIGTAAFLAWTLRVANKPQMAVNIVGLAAISVGLFKALG